jgi:ribosomal protein S18 acetylase RimI-like enzyme
MIDRKRVEIMDKMNPRDLTFRPAEDDDLPAVLELLRESTSGVLHAVWGEMGVRERMQLRGAATGIQACTVVDYVGIIIGHAISYRDAARSSEEPVQSEAASLISPFRLLRMPGTWYLSSIAVSPNYRRRGIGLRLLHCSASRAAEAGYGYLSLHVFAEKKAAVRLYTFAGLCEVKRTKLPSHPGVLASSDLLLMVGPISKILSCQRHFEPDSGWSISAP